jgi:hypothetical protein
MSYTPTRTTAAFRRSAMTPIVYHIMFSCYASIDIKSSLSMWSENICRLPNLPAQLIMAQTEQPSPKLLPRGIYPAATVFYKDDGATELDFDAMKRHVLRLAEVPSRLPPRSRLSRSCRATGRR